MERPETGKDNDENDEDEANRKLRRLIPSPPSFHPALFMPFIQRRSGCWSRFFFFSHADTDGKQLLGSTATQRRAINRSPSTYKNA